MNLKIVSGGQTGADQAGLEFAAEQGLEWGGWVPLGFKNESGTIPARFQPGLKEMPTDSYRLRTEANVADSDGTVIFYKGTLSPGSALTLRTCTRLKRPSLLINTLKPEHYCAAKVGEFILMRQIRVLNVAGSRYSKVPDIQQRAKNILTAMWEKIKNL